ncbi:MAG: methylated-DNA--[protein]-cysteine S-methyltransferase [Alphaproteobacteria bacterium]|nr:methylated-DNA--[protein]-cysteine S-methyltransferase [Alphaproteobacteria bacterium]
MPPHQVSVRKSAGLAERAGVFEVAGRDYETIRRAIVFLRRQRDAAPGLEGLADHLGLSASHCQKLFKRWCGLSPKEFTAAIAIDRAREMLGPDRSVLDTALEVGLSGGGRLHDLFVSHEAMTPGDYKRRGAGLEMSWGTHPTPFGEAVAVATDRGLAGLAFVDEDKGQTADDALVDLARRWPAARLQREPEETQPYIDVIFDPGRWSLSDPVRLVMIGTDFEVRVWQALLKIPMGKAVSYRDVAKTVCSERAARAVGAAVGKNPLSFVVPCHRVMRADGGLGGYHWGVTRKLALIGWEAGQIGGESEA